MQVHLKLSNSILLVFLDSLLEPIHYTTRVKRGTMRAKNIVMEHNTATPWGSIQDLFETKKLTDMSFSAQIQQMVTMEIQIFNCQLPAYLLASSDLSEPAITTTQSFSTAIFVPTLDKSATEPMMIILASSNMVYGCWICSPYLNIINSKTPQIITATF